MKKIPQAELKVMKFIWAKNDIVTSKEVVEAMQYECNWKVTTTLTILSRLVNKRFLASERISRLTHYTILITKQEHKVFETKRFLREVHSNSLESLRDSLIDISEKK
ncbi:BlaI/MecI/CopY family transcriptional regulator [Clostridioides difficile]|uniref:BlaI/MecI/CopY family transcriptional regulator n=1 Tax=Clostridioides difficile TaxID=1496 RepID=UPI000BB1D741|nr:BlaI/MecI/CopY family transcriptional regulator [Clostridioides difficile]PBE17026.1 transcriptional regulator [Clostridioides difficile]